VIASSAHRGQKGSSSMLACSSLYRRTAFRVASLRRCSAINVSYSNTAAGSRHHTPKVSHGNYLRTDSAAPIPRVSFLLPSI
jgi:hypothetical protein